MLSSSGYSGGVDQTVWQSSSCSFVYGSWKRIEKMIMTKDNSHYKE